MSTAWIDNTKIASPFVGTTMAADESREDLLVASCLAAAAQGFDLRSAASGLGDVIRDETRRGTIRAREVTRLQDEVDALYLQADEWRRKAVINTLSMGIFSSDRSIREYAQRIWRIKPVI